MAILKDVEVRVVSKGTNQPLEEYEKFDSAAGLDDSSVERYVESKDGEEFQVEVFLRNGFSCGEGWGIKVGIEIDGGVVSFFKPCSEAEVMQLQKSLKPIMLDSVPIVEGSKCIENGFRFDENLEMTEQELELKASTLGVIKVYVERVDRKLRVQPKPSRALYKPLPTTDVAKELLKEKHVDSVMQSINDVERAESAVQNTGDVVGARSASPLVVAKVERRVIREAETNTVSDNGGPASKEDNSMAERVQSLERQLKESQEKTEAMMRNLMGGLSTAIQSAFAAPSTASATTPNIASQLTQAKRERVKEEDENGSPIRARRMENGPVKRCKRGKEHAKEVPELLGTTENELGIRKWLEDQGHTLITTSDKEGENSTFDKELVDAEVIITTPFHPGYLTAERLAKAKNLKLAVTAGIGSDHIDLDAANQTNGGITVAEVTGSNVVSVAEHVIMTILVLVRNFVPAHQQIAQGDWNVAAVAKGEYDLENKVVGTVAVGRIGERVLRRLKPFDCKELLYYDYQPLKPEIEKEIRCRRVENLEDMLAQCDVVTINCPLHEKTRGMFNKELISKMKKGSWLVNTARGAIVVKEDVAEALKSGHLRGYGGDVWFPQPAPKEHPLRYATNTQGGGNATVAHMSGTSLDAQKRYAEGTKSILQSYFSGKFDYKPEDLIVRDGDYATKAYGQRTNKS
ncbi:MAG: hypothetical protein Q9216_006809 [Gyalolechia sp. 2 TL-2023]